jgi:hypothetical protein
MKSPPEDEKSEMECVASDQKERRRNKRPRRESTKSKTGGCGAHISSRDQQTRKRSIRPPCQGRQKVNDTISKQEILGWK